jgi:hypothetical protein
MVKSFDNSLSALAASTVIVEEGNSYPEPGQASVFVRFSKGEWLRAEFWRVVEGDAPGVSSFDHKQKYGLPEPVDAVSVLQQKLDERRIEAARLERETGDLVFEFVGNVVLRVFNFTGYEIWEMHFPNGAVEYSNYNK